MKDNELRGMTAGIIYEKFNDFFNTLYEKILKPTIKHMKHQIHIRRYQIKASRKTIKYKKKNGKSRSTL